MIKNDYIKVFQDLRDLNIIDYDDRVSNNFLRFFHDHSMNIHEYELKDKSYFVKMMKNTLDSHHYDIDYILVKKFFNLHRIVTKDIDNFGYINGIIKEGYSRKDFFLIKARNISHPMIHHRTIHTKSGLYQNIVLSDEYPFVEL